MSDIFTSGDFDKYSKYANLDSARGPIIKDIMDKAKEVARRIHEKYEDDKKDPTGNQNCLLCSWCAEALLRDYNILPRPVYSPRDPALEITPEDMLKGSIEKMHFKNFGDMQKWYLDQYNARFYVHVKWKNGNGGHEFLLLNTNVPHILDAQQGIFSPIVDIKTFKEYFTDIDYNETFLCRIDNHELDIENLKKINDDSALVEWDEEKDIPYMRDHDMMSDEENFDRVLVPSEEAIKYFKNNKELSSYWEDIAKASEGEFLVTKDTKEEIGHVFVHTNKKDKGFIYNVNVEKKFRRKGFGWILVDDAVKKFNGEDLTVDADNTPAVNLYLKYGFKIIDRGYWHNDGKEELWMKYDRSKLKQESFVQEGHFEDRRNGVNPKSKKLFFHVTSNGGLDGRVFKPRVPDYLDEYDPEDTSFENTTTPRVCFSPSIEGCINAIAVNFMRINPIRFEKLYVYIPEKPINEYRHKSNKELIRDKDVFDANVTGEMWILEPVRLKLYGVIRIDQWKKVHRKNTVPNIKNEKDTRPYYSVRWHWLVKPKVVASTEKSQYNYDVKSVCTNLGTDLYKFKYGLIRNGRLITSNDSEEDYDKYWVMHTAQEVDEAGGGNCYDMVEYEADYLESYGVKCNKYYISATYHGRLFTHTFVVVPDGDKFIYIERAFKRISDEFTNNKREFDNLNDIFNYIIECMCEYESVPELDYIVIDYTDCTPKVGTDIKHFQNYIVNHGDEVAGDNFKLKKK